MDTSEETQPLVKVVCCVCGKILKDGPEDKISHTYCEVCKEKALKDIEDLRS